MKNLKLFTVILFFLLISKVKAQYVFVPDQNGKPLTDARYENITGTPYLVDEWTNAEVKLADNTIIKPEAVKYDMVSDKLLFKQENKIYEFYPKVAGFSLYTNNGTRTFLLKDNTKGGEGYFEVLNNGKIKLMKKVKKVILETKGYNSANLEKTVDENKKYFINLNGSEKEVKLTKKSFMEALPQFKSHIENYKLKSSNEEAFIVLLETLN